MADCLSSLGTVLGHTVSRGTRRTGCHGTTSTGTGDGVDGATRIQGHDIIQPLTGHCLTLKLDEPYCTTTAWTVAIPTFHYCGRVTAGTLQKSFFAMKLTVTMMSQEQLRRAAICEAVELSF